MQRVVTSRSREQGKVRNDKANKKSPFKSFLEARKTKLAKFSCILPFITEAFPNKNGVLHDKKKKPSAPSLSPWTMPLVPHYKSYLILFTKIFSTYFFVCLSLLS